MPYKLSLLLSFFFIFLNAKAQTSKEIIEVKVKVLGLRNEINDTITKFYSRWHFARVEIRNTQDTAISFYVHDCPTIEASFLTDNDSIFFASNTGGCDMSFPQKIVLQPKQRAVFHGSFYTNFRMAGRELKLGFVMLSINELLWKEDLYKRKRYKKFLQNHKIYWSDKVLLKDVNTDYYIENF